MPDREARKRGTTSDKPVSERTDVRPSRSCEAEINEVADDRVRRVAEMEDRLNRVVTWLGDGSGGDVAEDVRALDEYYHSCLQSSGRVNRSRGI